MTREEAIWWVNHLFEIRKEEYFNKRMMEDAKEVEEAQHIVIKALKAEAETNCIAQINVDVGEIIERIKEEYDIKRSKGEWIKKQVFNFELDKYVPFIECSVCGYEPYYGGSESQFNYCANCGADMRGKKE